MKSRVSASRSGFDRRRPRSRFLLAILLLVAITLFAVDRSVETGPLDAAGDGVRDGFASLGGIWPFGGEPSTLEAENERLRAGLEEARGALARTEDIERQRQSLMQLLALPAPLDVPKVAARVTDVNASNYDATIEIDKGTDAGIVTGMPVVTGAGLVGRVTETSGTRATILLIGDSTSNVGVRVGGTGEIGVAAGRGATRPMRVDLIDLDTEVSQGDVAVTSGLDGSLFPPGIPVGRVTETSAGPQSLRSTVELEQFVDVSSLDIVAVLQYEPA